MTGHSQDARRLPGLASAEAHILVVDDDSQIRQLAAKLLREHGYRVSLASNDASSARDSPDRSYHPRSHASRQQWYRSVPRNS